MNSVLKHEAFEKRFLVHWLIVVTSLGLFFYLHLDSKSNNETALTIDDLSYVKGQFTEAVCLKGSSRGVDSIDFTFAVKGGDVMKATGAIRSTLSCRDEIVDLLVNAPSSREAELWYYQGYIMGISFGEAVLKDPQSALVGYNLVKRSNFFPYFFLLVINFLNILRWRFKWKQLLSEE